LGEHPHFQSDPAAEGSLILDLTTLDLELGSLRGGTGAGGIQERGLEMLEVVEAA